jgi:hypothetical protein
MVSCILRQSIYANFFFQPYEYVIFTEIFHLNQLVVITTYAN